MMCYFIGRKRDNFLIGKFLSSSLENSLARVVTLMRLVSSLHSSTSSSSTSCSSSASHSARFRVSETKIVLAQNRRRERRVRRVRSSTKSEQEWEDIPPLSATTETEKRDTEEIPVGRKLAISAFAVGTAAFVSATGVGGSSNSINAVAANLAQLERESIDVDVALSNEKPTVLEFYADWCEVCKSSAPYVFDVEKGNKKDINFVMMNIDNTKWTQEMDDYDVDGIPHLEFLDRENKSKGALIGKFPKEVLEANIDALKSGEDKLPYAKVKFQSSPVEVKSIMEAPSVSVSTTGGAVDTSDPRAHG